MDPQVMNDGGGADAYNFAAEWPGFHMNANTTTTSYGGLGLGLGGGLDPMVMDHRSMNHNSRKRREDEYNNNESAKGGASTSNSNCNSSNNVLNEGDSKRLKVVKSNNNLENKVAIESNSSKSAFFEFPFFLCDQSAKPSDHSKQDYIHVRARRGQATDSHSLAERARREKISERMKTLQDIVPNCNKVIGKALVLDEIINYVQSLQRQVEFLSMKLEAVNTKPGIEGYPSKDFFQHTYDASSMAFGSQSDREYVRGSSPDWLHMQIGGGFERTS